MLVSELKKYKETLYSSLSRDLSEFEKNFLLISSGVLAFSITFIKEIVKIEDAHLLAWLFWSWGLIIASIGVMMFTFLQSSSSCDKLWSITDKFIITNKLYDDTTALTDDQVDIIKKEINSAFYRSKLLLRSLRYVSIGFFILGISSLSIFVSINLLDENQNKKVSDIDKNGIIVNTTYKQSLVKPLNLINYEKRTSRCSRKTDSATADSTTTSSFTTDTTTK